MNKTPKRLWDNITGVIQTALQMAKRSSRYHKEPFNTFSCYLPTWMHDDDDLMDNLAVIFMDWYTNGGHAKHEYPSAYMVRQLIDILKEDEK